MSRINKWFCREEPEEKRKRNDKKEATEVSQSLNQSQLTPEQRRFLELHEQIESLIAELPPSNERTAQQKAELKKLVQEKWKMKKKLDGKVDHLIPKKTAMSSTERSQICRERKTDSEKQQEREANAEQMRRNRKR